jgi:hypothetical protein
VPLPSRPRSKERHNVRTLEFMTLKNGYKLKDAKGTLRKQVGTAFESTGTGR